MRRYAATLTMILMSTVVAMAVLGARSEQGAPPPLGYFGTVFLQGQPAPEGLLLVACVMNCNTGWEGSEEFGEAVRTRADGGYSALIVGPPNDSFIGEDITFWIVNESGRIQADEVISFVPSLPLARTLNLTFSDPLPVPPTPTPTSTPTITPTPTVTPVLPIPGDSGVPMLGRIALITGVVALVVGGAIFIVARRRRAF